MKRISNMFRLMVMLAVALVVCSCEKSANEEEWGNSYVYMPQASLLSDGLNNCYTVPSQINGVKNYRVENGRIKVFLGVYRSGLEELESYTVQIVADADTCRQCINAASVGDHDEKYDVYENAVVLPDDCYELPSQVVVSRGERSNTFYLEVLTDRLKQNQLLSGKTLVMAVRLGHVTRYELNAKQAVTMVVINDWESLN